MYLELRMKELIDIPPQKKVQKYDPIPACKVVVSVFNQEWEIVNQCFERVSTYISKSI